MLIDGFIVSFYETNKQPSESKVIHVDMLSGIKLKDVRSKILMTFRYFPFGYNRDFLDFCNIGPEIKTSDWVTYKKGSSYAYYEVDKW
jgi:hypothetical protein